MTESKAQPSNYSIDYLTVIALSILAYTIAVLLHEYLGHAVACINLGGHLTELGAFYIICQYANMPDLSIRLVALAGPVISLMTGAVGLWVFDRLPQSSAPLSYIGYGCLEPSV